MRKMFVLPRPVGSTTRVFLVAAFAKIASWYNLGLKFLINVEERDFFYFIRFAWVCPVLLLIKKIEQHLL